MKCPYCKKIFKREVEGVLEALEYSCPSHCDLVGYVTVACPDCGKIFYKRGVYLDYARELLEFMPQVPVYVGFEYPAKDEFEERETGFRLNCETRVLTITDEDLIIKILAIAEKQKKEKENG